jgi:4,4'-diaponeurosporenoate glycosyltransferase
MPFDLTLEVLGWAAAVVLLCRVPKLPGSLSRVSPVRTVSVVIPARDEADTLPRLLSSLEGEGACEVIVVDDASTDDTSNVAARAGAKVISTAGPPPGWTGKTWACHVGTTVATGEVIVFLDADTWVAPGAVRRLVDAHDELTPQGLLSVQPHHVTERPYEQLSAIPNLVAVMASGMAAIRRPRARPVAFGPCLVTRRDALRDVGGFASVRSEVVEDLALARRFDEAGRPVRCLAGRDDVRFRMYPGGLRSLIEGWTKNLAAGAARAPVLPAAGAALWVTGALSTTTRALLSPSLDGATMFCAYAAQVHWGLARLGSFRWWTALAFPVTVAAFVGFVAASAIGLLRGEVVWRGRRVAVGR